MRTETPPRVRLIDYRPYPFMIDRVSLDFDLKPTATRVKSIIHAHRTSGEHAPMRLDGEALKLISIHLDGVALSAGQYELTADGMTVTVPESGAFVLEIETEISPETNTQLSGLYMSGGRFCTQCEAEGFRRITYYPDRPDVMAPYDVRITADPKFPYLLSNGNPGARGVLEDGRLLAHWSDPHPKPSYLFALVAGDFDVFRDEIVTRSGNKVDLAIFVDKGDASRAAYAMDSLKRSMRWDEDVFGREYDLDVFNIVAVRDFNFGAMENKGLNVFNSAYVLADGDTATDLDFEAIESIVAHEYFHNWTGNRITCRDWFQLCLKEGLTVYRDQEFSADMRSRPVQRIKDVIRLRSRQFPEDAGPLAHQVRPDQYARIDNLYTATVYEKGSELIRMLRTLIGDIAFFAGLNRYFDRQDGTAATIEDFLDCFQPSTDEDLGHFALWYAQPGTPNVVAKGEYEQISKSYRLTLTQHQEPTPVQAEKAPLVIALRTALFSSNGQLLTSRLNEQEAEEHIVVLREAKTEFVFEGVASPPILSINRGFSAPVRINDGLNDAARQVLAACDNDRFSQWESLQTLSRQTMLDGAKDPDLAPDDRLSALVDALDHAARAASDDAAFAALLLRLPTVGELVSEMEPADPDAIQAQRVRVKTALARRMKSRLEDIVDTAPDSGEFDASAKASGKRALISASLDLLSYLGPEQTDRISDAFETASTMTESLAALTALSGMEGDAFDEALGVFESQWSSAPLIMDKWYSVQAMSVRKDIPERLQKLSQRADFDLRNPNRVRALAAAFSMNNPVGFNASDGWGYHFLADIILQVDPLNPALSARLCTAFENWRRFTKDRRTKALEQMRRLNETELSKNASDIISRALGDSA